jgi:hypothetical protein
VVCTAQLSSTRQQLGAARGHWQQPLMLSLGHHHGMVYHSAATFIGQLQRTHMMCLSECCHTTEALMG